MIFKTGGNALNASCGFTMVVTSLSKIRDWNTCVSFAGALKTASMKCSLVHNGINTCELEYFSALDELMLIRFENFVLI